MSSDQATIHEEGFVPEQKDYEPWNDSYSASILITCGAILFVWAGVILIKAGFYVGKELIFISTALVAISVMVYARGSSREFGKAFEEKATKKIKALVDGTGIKILPPRMTRVGDIDLLVECPSERLINVEIKSWRSFGEDEKFGRREKKGISQIHAQRGAVGSDISILWLPQANQSFWRLIFNPYPKIDEGIYLCCGNARRLRKLLNKLGSK